MFKGIVKASILLAAFLVITACSPKLNWRIVQSPEQRYVAQFPGKPNEMVRLIPYQDQDVKQALEAVKIDDDIYSISSIRVEANQGV
ncbi:hypothetical protein [Polynucleobacter necessarius]|uniref:hypothetical protein n=1 Tax=Polynucleobacter necessarius TaxID=576610 RepID=UPI001E5F8352|nr:hypothetical protein [Polynucleobacter necessarius]